MNVFQNIPLYCLVCQSCTRLFQLTSFLVATKTMAKKIVKIVIRYIDPRLRITYLEP